MIPARQESWHALASCVLLALAFGLPAHADDPNPDYLRDVRPILADNCFRCHGADEQSRKAELRLDVRESAVRGGDSGDPAIVPGKPDASQLIHRITSRDESEQMPPPDAKSHLTPAQIETLSKWIANGAQYQIHWALVPPRKPPLPTVPDKHWGVNEIDQFVLSRLHQEQLSPSAEATRSVLLR